ncbi:glycosyltransferase family 4 protein [Bosea sp. (in: a-proteobacteria)]|uniref:glycosyltransferase family 4 protein n=1 Tax=Bosea sp. (in: a-proteobacteria) TaxID=1871050 RepID=UPI00261F3265|nr:glycosyltransferase family 4 protein [Bosea sp. (in: a-proteobacteria)]MCO5090848.1 glycosyltransferase family 4 protein [Bosea sp. (in: a-proteobacteria)]
MPRYPRKLHVLVATPSGIAGQGGIDRMMAALKQEFERQGIADIDLRFLTSRGSGHVAFSVFHTLGFCLRMLAARLAGRADVVHLNLSVAGSTYRKMAIAACARLLSIPYVLHLHGGEYPLFWKDDDGFLSRRIRSLFEHAAQVIVLGRVWQAFVAGRAPGVREIAIVPNAAAIPTLAHSGGGDRVHILFLGRLSAGKGVPELCEALSRLRTRADWRATIAGDGDVAGTGASLAALGIAERVALPGWVAPDAVAALIATADILVLPSFVENLPLSVIEGMAAGLAVVATPVGAVEDIVTDGQSGLLVAPGDVGGLTAALERLVDDPPLRARLGAAALAVHRERLALAPFVGAICGIWRSVASRKPPDEG